MKFYLLLLLTVMIQAQSVNYKESELLFNAMWNDVESNEIPLKGFDPETKTFYAKKIK